MRGLLRALFCLNLAACVLAPATAMSQAYPSKPIRLVVPYPPGSSSVDIIGRIVATKMSESLGQSVVIDNRAGANGTIGSEYVARAAPDGYTLLFGTSSSHVISMFVAKSVPYDAVKDFTPLTMAGSALTGMVASPSFAANSVKELVEFARKYPGKVSYASNGVGSIYHLCGELLKLLTGTDMVHVPFKGGAQLLPNVMSGQIPVTFASLISVLPQVKSGKLKLLAVLEPTRYAELPEVASINETLPEFRKPPAWLGFFGPANLPAPVLARLNAELVKTLKGAEVRAKLEGNGFMVIANTPEQFAAAIQSDIELTRKIVNAARIEPE